MRGESTSVVGDLELTTVVLVGVGSASVVLGGLISAVAGPFELAHGSWLAAYLVLVAGVAQVAMGLAQEYLGGRRVAESAAWVQVACWNLGNAGVVAGTLVARPGLVVVGGLVLLPALAIALLATRNTSRRLLGWAFRVVVVVLAVSIPIGVGLSAVRHGG